MKSLKLSDSIVLNQPDSKGEMTIEITCPLGNSKQEQFSLPQLLTWLTSITSEQISKV